MIEYYLDAIGQRFITILRAETVSINGLVQLLMPPPCKCRIHVTFSGAVIERNSAPLWEQTQWALEQVVLGLPVALLPERTISRHLIAYLLLDHRPWLLSSLIKYGVWRLAAGGFVLPRSKMVSYVTKFI